MCTIADIILHEKNANPQLKVAARKINKEKKVARERKAQQKKVDSKNPKDYPKFNFNHYNFGDVWFNAKNIDQRGVQKSQGGEYYIHTARPTGFSGKVVNVNIFSKDPKNLKPFLSGKMIKVRAKITQKIMLIESPEVESFEVIYHNLDLYFIDQRIGVDSEVKICQGDKPMEIVGMNNPTHQGGYIGVKNK